MAKKKQSQAAKILKQKQLQQLASGQPAAALAPAIAVANPGPAVLTPLPTAPIIAPTEAHIGREIWRTVISLAIVGVLLVGSVIVNDRTTYFSHFGSWLYTHLRLQ